MPYVKKEEYEKMKQQLTVYKKLKKKHQELKYNSSWRCIVCEKKYFGMDKLYLFNGDSVCGEDKTPYFSKIALLTIKGLRKNYLINNIEKSILKYLYEEWDGEFQLADTKKDYRYAGGSSYGMEEYCIDRYNNGDYGIHAH